jgi:hypothetical protein
MKRLATIFFLLSFSTFAKESSVEDSLIANIGKKAKVIFYADDKADFNEIAKYDLNKLFAEVRKRSEKNFSNNEEVTLREVDENLKNREVNTTVSTKKWLKNMNLNLFVGASPFTDVTKVVGSAYFSKLSIPNIVSKDVFNVENRNSLMIGVGGFFNKNLLKRNSYEIYLNYGLGFDLMATKIAIKDSGIIGLPSSEVVYERFGGWPDIRRNQIISTNLYAQLMPTFSFTNSEGQKTFSGGIGFKVASNFNNITFNEYLNSRAKLLMVENSPAVSVRQSTLQTALVINIGYKYINAFLQVTPNQTSIESKVFSPTFPFDEANKQVKNTYTIGLRFGK